jgi:hypothetical protein
MMKKRRSDPKDFGTPEIAKRLKVIPTLVSPSVYAARVTDEHEIDRLLVADKITPNEHATLEGLLRRLVRANFVGVRSPTYDAPMSADPSLVGDRRANQIRTVVGLFSKLDDRLGVKRRKALVNLVLLDEVWPKKDKTLQECIEALEKVMRD